MSVRKSTYLYNDYKHYILTHLLSFPFAYRRCYDVLSFPFSCRSVINAFFIILRDHYNLVIIGWLKQGQMGRLGRAPPSPPSPHPKLFHLLTWRKDEAARWFLAQDLRSRSRKVRDVFTSAKSLCLSAARRLCGPWWLGGRGGKETGWVRRVGIGLGVGSCEGEWWSAVWESALCCEKRWGS